MSTPELQPYAENSENKKYLKGKGEESRKQYTNIIVIQVNTEN
jgi:hypothetical protein